MAETSGGPLFGVQSLAHIVGEYARLAPGKPALIVLPEGESEAARISFAELDRRARSFAAFLQAHEVVGERVLLLLPQSAEYVIAFIGCLYARAVAVPASILTRGKQAERVTGIIADCAPRMIITVRAKLAGARSMLPPGCAAIAIEDITESAGGTWADPGTEADGLAYLQYTSGSTSQPRGVMVGHRNIMHQLRLLHGALSLRGDEVFVSWLPLFHDMGLIGGLLLPLAVGATAVMMPPTAFIQSPLRWLAAVSRYRAAVSFAPNFALELCCEKISEEERRGLELSCLRSIALGAEPVRPETLEAFATAFGTCGVGMHTFTSGYGLAETTLAVCSNDWRVPPPIMSCDADDLSHGRLTPARPSSAGARRLVSAGRPMVDTELVIVEPASGRPCPDGIEGEIWLRGETVTAGYWGRADETERMFGARLADGRGPFLRTGDLGSRLGQNVYITGRLKDLIIIHGRNHHPHDIERTVHDAHPALATDRGAAFCVDAEGGGGEQLVIVQELKRSERGTADPVAVVDSIRLQVASEHDIVPRAIVLLRPASLPMTTSGKVRRHECKRLYLNGGLAADHTWRASGGEEGGADPLTAAHAGPSPAKPSDGTAQPFGIKFGPGTAPAAAPPGGRQAGYAAITGWLVARIADLSGRRPDEIAVDAPFASFGIDSMTLVGISGDFQRWLGRPVDPLRLYDYPTIARFAHFIARDDPAASPRRPAELPPRPRAPGGTATAEPVAVVGMACEFPGAHSAEEFWDLLVQGRDAIGPPPASRGGPGQERGHRRGRPSAGAARAGFIEDIDEFDAGFFGISAAEASAMDPQQRLLLTTTWRALEDAAIAPGSIAGGNAGVFIGISGSDYRQLQARDQAAPDAYVGTGNALSIAANRISYFLDLRGPSQAIDTACSSSLVAVHQAVTSLRLGECDLAIVGGVNLVLDPDVTSALSQAHMLAPDGRCKTFDASADGYVRGEGCGVVILERHADAIRRGGRALAIVKGSAISQDGQSNSLTAPNGLAQQAVIRRALTAAGMPADHVGYVEAHGTGTSLGDPIEVAALAEVYGAPGAGAPLWLGSVKTNIGHLEAAAGIAGLIKLVLSLRHGLIPAHLHLRQLNPYISIEGTRLRIPATAQDWLEARHPRAGAVSSFGFGGTNAHVIVTESPDRGGRGHQPQPQEPGRTAGADGSGTGWHLLPVSAKTRSALLEFADRYAGLLRGPSGGDLTLAAICHTAGARRDHHRHRLTVLATSARHAEELLRRYRAGDEPSGVAAGVAEAAGTPAAFLFTGQGAQFPGMARALYDRYALFRDVVDSCDEMVREHLGETLRPTICGGPGDQADLSQTVYAQPAMFVTCYAIASLWQACGLRPDYLLGHSLGEYVAACVGGVLTLEDAIRLVVRRGQLMQDLAPPGVMYAIQAPEGVLADLRDEIRAGDAAVAVAAENGPGQLVISGDEAAAGKLAMRYEDRGARVSRLAGTRAFHSPLIREAAREFGRYADQIPHRPARIPIVSNVTGGIATIEPGYWARQMQAPVRFGAGLRTLMARGCQTFVEAGPHPALTIGAAAARHRATWLASAARGDADDRRFLHSLADWYVAGGSVDWAGLLQARRGNAVPAPGIAALPPYPLARKRHWYAAGCPQAAGTHPLLGASADLAGTPSRWFTQTLTTARPWFLGHHRVLGSPVIPAAAILEWALAAARAATGRAAQAATGGAAQAWTLENVTFGRLMRLAGDQPADVQAMVETAGAASHVRCFSRVPGDGGADWTEAATVAVARPAAPGQETHSAYTRPDELLAGMTEQDIQTLYPRLRTLGLDYGPAFRGLKRMWLRRGETPGDGDAIGLVEAGPTADDAGSYVLHPVTLDACFHIAAAFLGGDDTLWLPTGVDRLIVYGSLPARVWCHARDRGRGDRGDYVIDLDLLSESGERLAVIEGLRFGELPGAAPEAAPLRRYELGWREMPDHEPDGAGPQSPGTWLILGEDSAAVQNWHGQLNEAGGTAIAVITQPAGARPGHGARGVNPDSEEDIRRLFAGLHAEVPTVAGLILHGAPSGAGPDEERILDDAYRVARYILLLKHFLAFYAAGQPEVVICSAGAAMDGTAMAGTAEDSTAVAGAAVAGAAVARAAAGEPDVAQGLLAGIARSVTAEYPDLKCVHADLEPGTPVPAAPEVLRRAASLPGAGHIALRGGRWHAAYLRESELPGGDGSPVRAEPDGTYLITGGLGGLGPAIATWLADRGARSLLIVGRNVPDAEPAPITALRSRGVRVTVWQADVADPAAVTRVIQRAQNELPAIRGVIHAAGVSADASLANLGWEQFLRVLDPKVRGAWHLHRLTAGLDLDFFVLFSSIASLTGSAGQSNYVLANAFLDSLARYRRHRGQTALSVSWGPWSQAGMAAREDLLRRLDSMGIEGIPANEALDGLGRLLGSPVAHAGLAKIAWHRFRPAAGRRHPDTLFDGLLPGVPGGRIPGRGGRIPGRGDRIPGDGDRVPGITADGLAELAITQPTAAREILLTELFDQTVTLLGVGAADRDELRTTFRHMRLSELGFDSLLAMQLRNRILADYAADVPPNDLLGQSTVLDAVELILHQLVAKNVIATGGDSEEGEPGMEVLTL
jgi:phthiocerol/phenolphthiocerol synthesis type-I polyketide synthase C